MRASLFLCAVLLGCGSPADPTDAGPDGAVPSMVRIVASEGGEVRSADGVFTLVVPPNALAEDTDIAITIVPRDQWPAEVAATSPIGEVYDVAPDGLEFLLPAYAVHRWDELPAELYTAEGDPILAVHYSQSASGAIETPPAETRVYSDVAGVIGEIAHLSKHWVSAQGRDGRELSARITAEAGTHAVGESWPVQQIRIHSNQDVALANVSMGAAVLAVRTPPHVIPVVHEGWRTTMRRSQVAIALLFLEREFVTYTGVLSPGLDPMTSIGPGNPFVVPAPLPGFTCVDREDPGTARISVSARVSTPGLNLVISYQIGYPSCTEPAAAAAPLHDHVIIGSACRVVPGSTACDPATSGSTVSIQALWAEESARCTELAPGTELCERVTGESEPGPDVAITTPIAEINATYDATEQIYSVDWPTDLEAIPDFEASGVYARFRPVEVPEATPIELPAPPPIESVEDILSDIEGISSVVAPRTGEDLDRLVIADLSGPGEPARLYRLLPGDASVPILDVATIAALSTRGLTVDRVLVGPIASVTDTTFFGRPMLVAAGRFIIADPADLVTPPEPGGVIVRDCSALPYDFTPITGRPGELAVLCLGADDSCFITNDVRRELTPLPSECPAGSRALVMLNTSSGPSASVNGDTWTLPWTSYGTDTTGRSSSPPAATTVGTIVERLGDGARWRIDYRMDGDTLHIDSAAPYSATLPPYGESWDARDTPRTFTSSYEVGTGNFVYARVCVEATAIFLHGNTGATPENEQCRTSRRYTALLVNGTGPLLDASHPGGSDWVVVSTTHGTMTSGLVTGLPTGVDVTTRLESDPPGTTFEMVYQYTGSGFIVQSVTEL